MVRNKLVATAAVITALGLTLTACGGSSSSTPTTLPSSSNTASPTDATPASLVGMQVEGLEGGAWPSAPLGAIRLWDNGTAWSQIEVTKGTYKWDNLEGAVQNATSKGVNDILMVLGTTPKWNATKSGAADYPQPGAASAPKDLAAWDAWVTAVVTRYKGRITSYEIWNEANLKNFYNGTPAEMAEMTKRAYDIIKKIDPAALVVAASPSLRLSAPFGKFYPAYLAELEKLGWPIDVLAIHTYPDGKGDPVARGALIKIAQDVITAAGAPDLPLWDTELNYGLAGPGDIPKQQITGAKAAGWIVRTYIDDLRYGVERSYWYIWTQKAYALLGIQAFPGSDGEQGFFALDNWVTGAGFGGCAEDANTVTCEFSKDGANWIVAWAQTGTTQYTAPQGTQLVCDPLQQCKEQLAGDAITLTEVPVRVYLQQ